MSKHRMVDGRLLQMNKSFRNLKASQREKIGEWMYQAFRKQTEEGLSDAEALEMVFDRIEKAEIWIPDHEILARYQKKKKRFRERLAGERVPRHIFEMESILEKATRKMDQLEKVIKEFQDYQTEIMKLEAYYTSQQWKDDYALDEAGAFPERLRRGVLSQDGIWNMLERNQELVRRIGTDEEEDHEESE